jgi:valyl-tRNA synthetase
MKAARYCLRESLLTVCKLLAPVCPHISEAIYREFKLAKKSVHLEGWPEAPATFDDISVRDGKLLFQLIADARREKSSKGLSLSSNLKKIIITANPEHIHLLKENEETILKTLKAATMDLERRLKESNKETRQTPEFKIRLLE